MPTSKTALARLTALAASPDPASPLDGPRAIELAARFHEIRREGLRSLVDLSVQLGRVLIEARQELRGSYHRWARERLGLPSSTTLNYMAMGRLAIEAPALVERHKELGASKLTQVARLAPDARHKVLAIAGIAALNDREFKLVVAPFRKRQRKVTGAMRAHGFHEKLRAYTVAVGAWKAGHLEDKSRAKVRASLRALRAAVDEQLRSLK